MSNTTVIPLRQPATIDDPLTEVLRVGARELLAKAVEAEVEEFLAAHAGLRTADGHQPCAMDTALSVRCKPASVR